MSTSDANISDSADAVTDGLDESENGVPSSDATPRVRSGPSGVVQGMLRTMRPHQWVKNVFVLAPVVFAKEMFDVKLLIRAGGAFSVFCLLAAAVYTLNDIVDAEADRAHPVKRRRPIASGQVGLGQAKGLLVALLLFAFGGAAFGSVEFFLTATAYFVMNVAYSFKLKHIAYLDVCIISAGFVLRVLAGGFGTRIQVSAYLFVCTALLALFLGFGKRRHELTVAAHRAGKQRAALKGYSERGLDGALMLTGLATVGVYTSYTLDEHTLRFFQSEHLWWTSAFVITGVLRFLFLVRHRPKAESPTQEMLKDGPFVATVLVWVMVVLWIVYNLRPSP